MSAMGGKRTLPLASHTLVVQPRSMFVTIRRMLSLVALLCGSTEALACSFEMRHYTDSEIRQMAEQALSSATAVVDGEVVSPMFVGALPEGALPVAFIKVSRTWKGQVEDGIAPVVYASSCDVPLETKGQKVRILLNGSGVFTASQFANGAEAVYERTAFNHEIDRLLGAIRPADFRDPGALPPAPKR